LSSLEDSFISGAGEFYVVESQGGDFRIRDPLYTDTQFLNTQAGDLFLIFAVRDGGDINIQAGELIVRDGAEISTATLGAAQGDAVASNIDIAADSVLVENDARISAVASTGRGGNLSIQTENLFLDNNSTLTSSAIENAGGGNIIIDVLDGDIRAVDSQILANSAQAGGGNITLAANTIRLEGNSNIQTDVTSGEGNGGNITLSADTIIAFDDSDLFAFAADGRGGDINLQTSRFFGESFTPASLTADPDSLENNNRADINATGNVDGTVSVPNVRFVEDGLTPLPEGLLTSEQLISNSCIARQDDGSGTLTTTGNDGLAIAPQTNSSGPLSTGNVQTIEDTIPAIAEASASHSLDAIVEPTNVFNLPDGRSVIARLCS